MANSKKLRAKKFRTKKLRTTALAFLFLLPALAIALVFVYFPTLYVFRLSFVDWDLISPVKRFIGVANFRTLLSPGSEFWNSLLRTVEYGIIYIPSSIILGLFFALALNRTRFLQGFFQTLYFIPSVTSVAVVAVVWSFMYNPQIGLFNRMLSFVGVPETMLPGWLNDPALAIFALGIMGTWQSLGFVILLFISGLNNIPKIYYDAARIDGAGAVRIFRGITLPLLGPVLFFVFFILIINSFRVFGAVAIMTKGRPLGSTNVVLYYIYQQAFRFFDAGLASAASLFIFLIMLMMVIFQFRLGERSVFYQ